MPRYLGFLELAPFVEDPFTRANENPLSGGGVWSTVTSESAWQVVSNQATPTDLGGTDDGAFYSGMSFPDDQYALANLTVNSASGGTGPGLIVRCASGARSYYRLMCNHAASANIEIDKWVAGVHTGALVTATLAWADGDEWALVAIGNWLGAFRSGQFVMKVRDTSHTSGSPGLGMSTAVTSAAIDNFQAGGVFPRKETAYGFPKPEFQNALRVGAIR